MAYEGTFGDLSAAGGAEYFPMEPNDFSRFLNGADGFTSINKTDGLTVSPRDVVNNGDSFPPSASFSYMTTPGSTFLETPDEDYLTSPMLSDNLGTDFQGDMFPPLPSLFDDSDSTNVTAPYMERTTSASSVNQIVVHPGTDRKRSSTIALSQSPALYSPAVKHSSVAGVKARKRDQPLGPIIVNENDPIALKRARNTDAARKSRAKKVEKGEEMENEIAILKEQVEFWKKQALARGAPDEEPDE